MGRIGSDPVYVGASLSSPGVYVTAVGYAILPRAGAGDGRVETMMDVERQKESRRTGRSLHDDDTHLRHMHILINLTQAIILRY